MILDSPIITGSLQVSGSISSTGPFDGSITSAVTASYLNGNVTASGHLVPDTHEAYDLGSSTLRWRDLYLSGSTINLGGTEISADADGHIEFHVGSTRKKLIVDELIIGSDSSTQRRLNINNGRLRVQTDGGSETEVDSAATASYVAASNIDGTVTSASYALTASYAENAGGGSGFPFTGSADVTGSLNVTGSVGFSYPVTSTGTWSAGGALITARRYLAGAGTQNAGLAIGGCTTTACTEEYGGSSWTAGGALITARWGLAGAGTQDAGLAFGGLNPPTFSYTCTEEYDGSSWTAGGALITGRPGLAGVGTQNSALAIAGYGMGSGTEEYNGTSWASGGNLIFGTPSGRQDTGGAGTQNAALAIGGCYGSSPTNSTEEYDGTSWSSGGDMITSRNNIPAGAGTQNAGLAFGGGTPALSCTEEYDGSSWTAGGALITARMQLGGSCAGTQTAALGFGGCSPSALVACTEEYTAETSFVKSFDYSSTTGNLSATGSFTGSFTGDGSNLTGVGAFPYTGSAGVSGSLTVVGTTTSTTFVESSALRYKEDIKPLNSQLDKVMQLKPVSYTWSSTQDQHIGLVAEEVNKLYPEFVGHNNKGEIEGIQYSKMVSVLIQSIQEQQQQINELKAQLNQK